MSWYTSLLTKIPAVSTVKVYAWGIILVLTIGAFGVTTVAAYRWGREAGSSKIQIAWDAEKKKTLQSNVDSLDRTLTQSRADAAAAAEQARKDLAAALAASEERQALRMEAAIRQADIEAATRAPGSAYVNPVCKLDANTYKKLQEALK